MAAGGRAVPAELRGLTARDGKERHKLRDMLCDQLSRDLLRLLNEGLHADIVLNAGQAKFKAHKVILLARVPRFYIYITRYSSAEKNILGNIKSSEIRAFLQVVYSCHWKVKDREEHILSLIDEDWMTSIQEHEAVSHSNNKLPALEDSNDNKCLYCITDSSQSRAENGHPEPKKEDTVGILDTVDLQTASGLVSDLLSFFHRSCCPDVTFQIEDKQFPAHRAILSARSSYFAAMLSGCWAESSQDVIQIQGIQSADMIVIMHFIYGGILDLPKNVDPGHILSIADMYGLEGLKEVAIYVLKRDYCKFFHKPQVGMQHSVFECLSIAYSLGEKQLYNSCMRWIEKYFVKCWSEESFSSLHVDLRKECLTVLVQSLAQGMSSTPYLLEQVFNEIEKSISFENSPYLFMALDELFIVASGNEMGFTCKIQALREKLWTFLLQSFYAVRHTEGWKLMRPDDQQKIEAAAVDKGDDRRLTKKPILTSSQQNRSKIARLKDNYLTSVESKRQSEGDSSKPRKMKSDSLGAPGHSSNVVRNTSAKGKDDDAKGKDGKKTVTKGAKDPKAIEKAAVTKPKVITKTKQESNGHAKTESCPSKGDATGTAKSGTSGKLGARPKVSNGSVNSQTKVKSLKKVSKEPSSPVKGSVPNVKSVISNGEPSGCNRSPEELNHDATSSENRNTANCSPQSGKTMNTALDGSKDTGLAVKSESPSKMTNGASSKRKVNDECRGEVNSSLTKKTLVNGANESVLQKKKVTKVSNSAAQRPKSAPAAVSKKQGTLCDGASPLKSGVSSKQADVKSDAKLMSQSSSSDKRAPLNKKSIKTALGSSSKTSSQTTTNKQSLGGNKCALVSHKEPKQKVLSESHMSKVSALNHRLERKDSPAEFKNSHDQHALSLEPAHQQADGFENHESLKNDGKQAVSCVEPSGHSEQFCSEDPSLTDYEHCHENSIGNQISMTQKPNLERCYCQENTQTASAEVYASDSKASLTDVKSQRKQENADMTSLDEHFVLNILNDQKLEGKNICDSENSKCADSSSESELCSVKEVERNLKEKDLSENVLLYSEGTDHVLCNSVQSTEPVLHHMSTGHQAALRNHEHFINCSSERPFSECPRDLSITEIMGSHENGDIHFASHWNKHSSTLHERESPESESGSASTSSDDIKPRSEDYDAGGSQDDDGSNERGISKCSTMRCHDFLGRSSSDTSTPEELKGYDGSLRIDVKVKKDNSDLFRINSTSDDEVPRKRSEMWLQRDVPKHSVHPKALCSSVQFPQEIEHLSSSADETEDERSEAENAVEKGVPGVSGVSSEPFQGIVNLAFDDNAEIESEGQLVSGNKPFTRSVLLSVDECEELGSDEGEPHPSQGRKAESLTPAEVFEKSSNEHSETKYSGCPQKELDSTNLTLQDGGKQSGNENIFLVADSCSENCVTSSALVSERQLVEAHDVAASYTCKGFYKHPESEHKSQTRPCHLDLYTTDSPSDMQRFCPAKTLNACKSDILDHQVKDSHAPPTESSNTALPPGHIDDFDSLAQTSICENRPSKSLSPIYEMDPRDGIEQRMTTEPKIMDFGFEDQHFVDGDWTLLRQLLEEHGSDVDIINSVPEDLSLAQYLINQTLLLARENSKSQGKAHVNTSSRWGDLSSPFDDSTSATMTSFSPDDSSPHGEWTILELETHH
ncbi:BTB/POZ domain-containing protein 8 isoform X2 [Pelobates fuscus]|uniref:BTB/POZ domain-containing protein 8 isoform X2 n=1 Tax=Pelobates fuscus TaxID=191477 RepID=UPI002FE4A31A